MVFFLLCCSRRGTEGRRQSLAVRAHKEGQWLSADFRPADRLRDSTPPSQPVASRPPVRHPLHPIHPLRHLPSSPLGLGVGGAHARGAGVVRPQRKPPHGPVPDVLLPRSPAPRAHVHPACNSALQEAPPAEAPLHPSASVPQSAAPPSQHHPDAQQEPRVPAGQPHRGPALQQVGAQRAVCALREGCKIRSSTSSYAHALVANKADSDIQCQTILEHCTNRQLT